MTTVLIIEDEESSQMLVRKALAGIGHFNVLLASDGAEALRHYDGLPLPPDIVICDIFLPDMDGLEVINALERRRFAGGLLLITAGEKHFMDIAVAMASAAGLRLWAALLKPLTEEALRQALLPQEAAFPHSEPTA